MDAGEDGNGRSDAPMDVVMEMASAVTATAAGTAGGTIFELMERNKTGRRRRRNQAPAAPSDWKCRMGRTIRLQAQELRQRHRTVGHLAHLVEAQAAGNLAQQQAMMTWMQKRQQKWDSCNEDEKVSWAGITNMIAMLLGYFKSQFQYNIY